MESPSQPNGPLGQQADDLLATQKLLRATLDASTDMIQVFEAVRNQQGEIIDFTWILNNHASEQSYGDVVGKSLLELQPGVVKAGIFAAFKQVVETGTPQQYEKHYVHEQFDGWFHQSVVKLNDGVATTTANITPRKTAEQQLQQSQALLQSVIDSSLDVIQVFKAVRDETGAIRDFVWLMNNQKAVAQNGQVIGQSLLKQNPGVVPTGIFDHMVEVTQTGVAYEQEQYYHHEQFDAWFYQALVKTEDGVTMTTRDISRQKQAEGEILRLKDEVTQKAEDKYHALFNAVDEGFCIQELIYNESGKLVDLRTTEANLACERQTGFTKDVIGRRHSEFGLTTDSYWFDIYDRIAKTGEPETVEAWHELSGRWYHASLSRIGEAGSRQLAVVFNDITERKHNEQRQEFLLSLSDALRVTESAQETGALAMRMVAKQLSLDRCWVCRFAKEQGLAWLGPEYCLPELPPMSGEYSLVDFPETMRQVETSSPAIDDVRNDPGLSELDRRSILGLGMGAYMTTILRRGEQGYFWALCASTSGPRSWTKSERQLLNEVTERVWAAIERARAEEALRASQKRFESIANLVPDLLWDSRPDGSISWYNDPWLAYTGQSFEEAIGRGWVDAIHPDDRQASARRYAQAVATGKVLRQEHRIRRYDGAYHWFVVSASPLKDEAGHVVKMYGAATDIDDLKRLETSLLEANRRKDEFLAMLGHELRNPMSTLHNTLLLLELTQGQDETLPLDRALAMMSREVIHLNRMVDDLLDVGRISQGKIELKKQRLDLARLLRETLEAARPQFSSQGHGLTSQLPDQPIWVGGDHTRLTQVIRNLLTNAAKYTPPGGQIIVALGKQDHQAVLRIRDTGIGIAADQLEAIFEVFVQVSSSLDRPQGGLGLGLAVVKQLVELHGGQVGVQSAGLGQGSEFTVRLPRLPDAPPSLSSRGASEGSASRARRILVVDDNADLALTTAMLLRVKKFEADTCLSGSEALTMVASFQPDAVLLDLGMPGMDGYKTCRRLRTLDWGKQGVIVALSGYGQEEDKQRTQEAGFDGHLVKPINLQTLTALLDRLLNDTKPGQ